MTDDGRGFLLGVEHRLFNAELRRWRHERGYTQRQVAAMLGVAMPTYSHIEALRSFPSYELQGKISDLLGLPVEQLFPAWLKECVGRPTKAVTEHRITPESLSEPKFAALPSGGLIDEMDDAIDRDLLGAAAERALDSLDPRERDILKARFGFEGEPMTLEAIAERTGFGTRERIRQLEARALQRLRHKRTAMPLIRAAYLDDGPPDTPRPVAGSVPFVQWLGSRPETAALAELLSRRPCCKAVSGCYALLDHLVAMHKPTREQRNELRDLITVYRAALPRPPEPTHNRC